MSELKLNKLMEQRDQISEKIDHLAQAIWKKGDPISWDHHGSRQFGTVLDSGAAGWNGQPRLRVRNSRTDKVYWIAYFDHDKGFYS